MTTEHPVLILSSSSPLRARSISPIGVSDPAAAARRPAHPSPSSSSTGLLSPSAFLRRPRRPSRSPAVQDLRSAPPAAKLPLDARRGFASARAVWEEQRRTDEDLAGWVTEEIVDKGRENVGDDTPVESAASVGKLVRPRKARASVEKAGVVMLGLDGAHDAVEGPSLRANGIIAEGSLKDVAVDKRATKSRKPGKAPSRRKDSVSKYFAEPDERVRADEMSTEAGGVERGASAKKPTRKRSVRSKAVSKTPKKLAKSASIILNSDDSCDGLSLGLGGGERATIQSVERLRDNLELAQCEAVVEDSTLRGVDRDLEAQTLPIENEGNVDRSPGRSLPVLETGLSADHVQLANDSLSSPRQDSFLKDDNIEPGQVPSEHAHRRRKSWTPVQNTSITAAEITETPNSTDVPDSGQLFPTLLKDFAYVGEGQDPPVTKRGPTGEAATKRRRVEVSATSTARKRKPKTPKEKPDKPPKAPRAAKKRPQTITALATAIYQVPAAVGTAETPSISAYMNTTKVVESGQESLATPQTATKTRKPRAKRVRIADQTPSTSSTKRARSKAKTTKAQAKAKEEELLPKLLSPSQARAHEQKQDFFFGTSSQLAVEESTEYIRDLQCAMDLSETLNAAEDRSKPEVRQIMRASTERMRSGLWDTAARDESGALFVSHEVGAVALRAQAANKQDPPPSEEIDTPRVADFDDSVKMHTNAEKDHGLDVREGTPAIDDGSDWMLLSSDAGEPPVAEQNVVLNGEESPLSQAKSPLRETTLDPQDSAIARPALRKLDANASLRLKGHLVKSKSFPLAESAVDVSSATFTKIDSLLLEPPISAQPLTLPAPNSPRKRGRPRKLDSTTPHPTTTLRILSTNTPPAQTEWTNIDDIVDPEPHLTPSPPRRRRSASASALQSSPPKQITNKTNNKKKSSTVSTDPPPLQTLQLTPPPLSTETTKRPRNTTSTRVPILRPTDPDWPAAAAHLFPQITRTLKALPPSESLDHPNWHEKILLYDPIVLEDFTDWLNTEGLTVQLERERPVPVTKKTAPKRAIPAAGGSSTTSSTTSSRPSAKARAKAPANQEPLPHVDVFRLPLKPWMLRKWCEEKSVCCLWKDRTWSAGAGVRNRY